VVRCSWNALGDLVECCDEVRAHAIGDGGDVVVEAVLACASLVGSSLLISLLFDGIKWFLYSYCG